jgi:hypothetical protein
MPLAGHAQPTFPANPCPWRASARAFIVARPVSLTTRQAGRACRQNAAALIGAVLHHPPPSPDSAVLLLPSVLVGVCGLVAWLCPKHAGIGSGLSRNSGRAFVRRQR